MYCLESWVKSNFLHSPKINHTFALFIPAFKSAKGNIWICKGQIIQITADNCLTTFIEVMDRVLTDGLSIVNK